MYSLIGVYDLKNTKLNFPSLKNDLNEEITEEKEKYKLICSNDTPINYPINSLEDLKIESNELNNIIKKLNKRKANRVDRISNKFMKIINKNLPKLLISKYVDSTDTCNLDMSHILGKQEKLNLY